MKKRIASLILAIGLVATLLSGCGGRRDVTHDENGFLGYSDDFWEWYQKNN